MKDVVIGIFAHPDDAAFGPGGTLALLASKGHEVHTICVTSGNAGINTDNHENLAKIREHEELEAARILGISTCEMLHYPDGELSNAHYHDIAKKLIVQIRKLADTKSSVTLITFDPNGISGHLDHIAVAHISTYVYLQLSAEFNMTLKYFCIDDTANPAANTEWVYMPKGRMAEEIDETVDVRSVSEQKIAAIRVHKTQAHDAEKHLARGEALFDEHFILYR